MSGRDRLFAAPQEDELVRQLVEDYFRKADPSRLEEVEEVFDLTHSMIGDRVTALESSGQRSIEGLGALADLVAGSAVTAVIWVATHLVRQARAPSPVATAPTAESILAELTRNPSMVAEIRARVATIQDVLSLAEGEDLAGRTRRDLKRRNPAPAPAPLAAAPPTPIELPSVLASSATPHPDLRLFVSGRPDLEGPFEFRLLSTDPDLGFAYSLLGVTLPGAHLGSFLQDLEKEIAHLQGADLRAWQDTGRRLARLGEKLLRQVLPERLVEALADLRGRGLSLLVYADAFLPWELLRFPDQPGCPGGFLAAEFALSRWFPGARSVHELPLRDIALIAPRSGLAAAAVEARSLQALAGGSRRLRTLPANKSRLLAALFPSELECIHFAGHGEGPPGRNPDFSRLMLDDDDFFDANDVPENSLPARPLVFLNACHSGKGGPLPIGIGGLARAFVTAGAGAVIGAHWAIADRLAETFAAELYRNFLAGLPLAEAVRRARLRLREADPNDPTWIAYTVFGQPGATCPPLEPAADGNGSGS